MERGVLDLVEDSFLEFFFFLTTVFLHSFLFFRLITFLRGAALEDEVEGTATGSEQGGCCLAKRLKGKVLKDGVVDAAEAGACLDLFINRRFLGGGLQEAFGDMGEAGGCLNTSINCDSLAGGLELEEAVDNTLESYVRLRTSTADRILKDEVEGAFTDVIEVDGLKASICLYIIMEDGMEEALVDTIEAVGCLGTPIRSQTFAERVQDSGLDNAGARDCLE